MLNNDISDSMKQSVEKIADKVKDKSNVYNIVATFTSKTVPDLRVELCREIKNIRIEQDMIRNITDKITMELELKRDDYVTMYYMRKDMACQLSISNIFPDRTEETMTPEELKSIKEDKLDFKSIVTKYVDIFKELSVERQWPTYNETRDETDQDRMKYKMSVELIDATVFHARKCLVNDVYTGVKMYDVIKRVCNQFGFTTAMVVKPDNCDREYTNFIIPPSFTVDQIMGYLQTAPSLGIYYNGLVSYITRWWKDLPTPVWFIYPRYAEPTHQNVVHVYSTGQSMYTGLNCNHWTCPAAGTSILVSEELSIKNYSDLGTENRPTGYNIMTTECIMDGTRRLIADDDAKCRCITSYIAVVPTDPMDTKDLAKDEWRQSKDNLFALRSELRGYQSSHCTFKWRYAKPWTLTPGTEVQVHYDHPLGFKTITGMAEHVVYDINIDESSKLNLFFICTCTATINFDNVQKPNESHV